MFFSKYHETQIQKPIIKGNFQDIKIPLQQILTKLQSEDKYSHTSLFVIELFGIQKTQYTITEAYFQYFSLEIKLYM